MENITLNNGQSRLIGSDKDIIDIVKEEYSYELGALLEKRLEELSEENLYQKERVKTDLKAYEAENEEFRDSLLEIQESLTQKVFHLSESKRVNKKELINSLNDICLKIDSLV